MRLVEFGKRLAPKSRGHRAAAGVTRADEKNRRDRGEELIRFGLRDLSDLPKIEEMAEALGFEVPAGLSGPSLASGGTLSFPSSCSGPVTKTTATAPRSRACSTL